MMFVGDKGRILAGFQVQNPKIMQFPSAMASPPPPPPVPQQAGLSPGLRQWMSACQGGPPSEGSFLHARGISEAVNLYAVALRTRRRLYYDPASRKITNVPDANKYLSREYRKGWNPE
jgi:hypothetical protein